MDVEGLISAALRFNPFARFRFQVYLLHSDREESARRLLFVLERELAAERLRGLRAALSHSTERSEWQSST